MIWKLEKLSPIVLTLAVGLGLLSGCGPDRPPLGSVSGTVTIDGQPLEKGSITFEVPGSRTASGEIVNGQIVGVSTYQTGDGAPVGNASVAITSMLETSAVRETPETPNAPGGPSGMSEYKSLIPAKYGNPKSSGLTATIDKGENVIQLELVSKG